MHDLAVLIYRNSYAAAREAAHADTDGDLTTARAIVSAHVEELKSHLADNSRKALARAGWSRGWDNGSKDG